ncbi:adrenocorticotropic hormone receptor-like [Mercenaria mercenaria]|uniref:adrenocorticotropic hormone receptor-like n=1 Tax=Mercenaria mercenaria TaxID=6596 RepID=UPI00234EA0F1|nr:adrenocorticotropic hormone receptor-like [Mercenaria mercenaria]
MDYLSETNFNETICNTGICNNTSNSSDVFFRNESILDKYRNEYDTAVSVIFYFNMTERVISFGGILLNLATIIILMSLKKSPKTQLKLIMSLAISDSLIALFHFLLSFFNFPNAWKFFRNLIGTTWPKPNNPKTVFAFIYTTTQFAGLGTMFAISVDILIKVRKPLRYKTLMSKRRGNIIVTCLWLVPSFLLAAVALLLSQFGNLDITILFIFGSVFYCLFCLLFFFIFLTIYTIILCSVKSFMHRLPSRSRHTITKTAVTFFLIIVTYFICILPSIWIFLLIFTNVIVSLSDLVLIMNIISCVYTLNTVLDPVIYAYRIPEINIRYKTLYRRICRCVRTDTNGVNLDYN